MPKPTGRKWLVKSEPSVYPWSRLLEEGRATWDGVRNFAARNNLRAMEAGDLAFFYHSGEGKEIVGVAEVMRTAFPDPTAQDGDWSAVELAPAFPLAAPVGLAAIKATPALAEMQLLRQSRLSVASVTGAEWDQVLGLGRTRPPRGRPASRR